MKQSFGFSGWYKDIHFRSLKELSYMMELDLTGRTWRSAEGAEFTVRYIDETGKERRHYPDFFVDNSIIVEIKPKKLHKNKLVKIKSDAMRKLCEERGYEYQIIAPKRMNKNLLAALIDSGVVRLEDRYKTRIKYYLAKPVRRKKSK